VRELGQPKCLFQAPRYWGKRELSKRGRKTRRGFPFSTTTPFSPDPTRPTFVFPFSFSCRPYYLRAWNRLTNMRVCQLRSKSSSARNQMGRHPTSSTGRFAQDAYRVWPQASHCHSLSGYRPEDEADHGYSFLQANWLLPPCHTIHNAHNEMRREGKTQYSSKNTITFLQILPTCWLYANAKFSLARDSQKASN